MADRGGEGEAAVVRIDVITIFPDMVEDFAGRPAGLQALPSTFSMAFQDQNGGTIVIRSRLLGDGKISASVSPSLR